MKLRSYDYERQMFYVVLVGCNKVEPVIISSYATYAEAQNHVKNILAGQELVQPSTQPNNFEYEGFSLSKEQFHLLLPNAYTCAYNCFIFNWPSADIRAMMSEVQELVN